MSDSTRRTFVRGAAAGLGLVVAGCDPLRASRGGGGVPDPRAQADGGSAGWWDTAIDVPDCEATSEAGEGPYYREGAPARVDLRTAGEKGTTFTLSGTVRSTADCSLLADAVVEVWHAMQTGDYDMTSDEMYYRCRLRVGFDGSFEIVTLKPVAYETDAGSWMPAHFHLRINAAGHAELITQLRFVDDPYDDGGVDESLLLDPDVASDGSESAHFEFGLVPSRG